MRNRLSIFQIAVIFSLAFVSIIAVIFLAIFLMPLRGEAAINPKISQQVVTTVPQNQASALTNHAVQGNNPAEFEPPFTSPSVLSMDIVEARHADNTPSADITPTPSPVPPKAADATSLKASNLIITGKITSDSALLGSELTDASGWTADGWTGDYAHGFTHITGNTSPLSRPVPGIAAGKKYQIVYTLSGRTEQQIANYGTPLLSAITIGGYTFNPWAGESMNIQEQTPTFKRGVTAAGAGDFIIVPVTTFSGTISSISIKEITSKVDATSIAYDSLGKITTESRTTLASLCNEFSGFYAGSNITSSAYSSAFGFNALANTTSGAKNTAVGSSALYTNTIGEANVAVGAFALRNNTWGSHGTAVGAYALYLNTTGDRNTALGREALFNNTTGYNNVAVGDGALGDSTTGHGNTAVGEWALLSTGSSGAGSLNTAVGQATLVRNSGDQNSAVGESALNANTTGNRNSAFGNNSLNSNTTGSYNAAFGASALQANTAGEYNSAFGYQSLYNNVTGIYNASYGAGALLKNRDGNRNSALGVNALYLNAGGSQNVAVGYQAGFYEDGSNHLWIDNRARSNLADGQKKALIYGQFDDSTSNQVLQFNALKIFLPYLPKTDPAVAGQLWNNKGVLTISPGVMVP